MDTPIYDFVRRYVSKDVTRFHMPGHKGRSFLGWEAGDITEIAGADVLWEARGIIGKSQRNVASLFHAGATLYSTEGSSLCIKAMLSAALFHWKKVSSRKGKGERMRPWILSARNVHRAMVDACAFLDLDVEFVGYFSEDSICTSRIGGQMVKEGLEKAAEPPIGVYLTSPDYLGQEADISGIASVCRAFGVPLLVDNAHGAYQAFLQPSRHPIQLGAAMCCDSAHKTLPVLTGGAYLHVAEEWQEAYEDFARRSMSLFGSTSPSYLILQSLDLCNRYLAEGYSQRLYQCIGQVEEVKEALRAEGVPLWESEPLKIVIDTRGTGSTGYQRGEELRHFQIECEYADPRFVVLMITPENGKEDFERLKRWAQSKHFLSSDVTAEGREVSPVRRPRRLMTIREAALALSEWVPVSQSLGRILAQETVSCPPAVPIGISGEQIDQHMIEDFHRYGIREIAVVAEDPKE